MKPYYAPYDMARYPALSRACRAASAVVLVSVSAAVLATAGPGNGAVPPTQWAAVHRPDVARVVLPAVQVVGQGGEHASAGPVSCSRGA